MKKLLNDFIKNEDGVTAIEYALIGVAMAVVVGAAVNGTDSTVGLKELVHNAFMKISDAMSKATDAA